MIIFPLNPLWAGARASGVSANRTRRAGHDDAGRVAAPGSCASPPAALERRRAFETITYMAYGRNFKFTKLGNHQKTIRFQRFSILFPLRKKCSPFSFFHIRFAFFWKSGKVFQFKIQRPPGRRPPQEFSIQGNPNKRP